MKQVIQNGDSARGHTDILGNEIVGMISSSHKAFVLGVSVSRNGDLVHFPSHPHEIILGVPSNYRSHDVAVVGSGKLMISVNCALEGDVVPVADEAGGNATMQASQFKLYSN